MTSSSSPRMRIPAASPNGDSREGPKYRAPDHPAENAALLRLVRALRDTPGEVLTKLADAALQLCRAGSSGVSILESSDASAAEFRWRALAGAWAPYLSAALPRAGSPCSSVFDFQGPQLLREPVKDFPGIARFKPECRQMMLAPFFIHGAAVGALWVVNHEPGQGFDHEDARLLNSLAEFGSAAYQTLKSVEGLVVQSDARRDENAVLVSADRSKDAFIAIIAHELRDPLAPLVNASAVLKLRSGDPAVVNRAADLILRQVKTISRLVEDLLDVSRVRLGVLELRAEAVELSGVLQSAIGASELVTRPTKHRLEFGTIESPVPVFADEMRLSQVLRNLLNNAAKYTDADGLIKVGLRLEAEDAVITISDSGIGIPADQLETVFDLFAQAGQSAHRDPKVAWA